jgi:hypothetical protein
MNQVEASTYVSRAPDFWDGVGTIALGPMALLPYSPIEFNNGSVIPFTPQLRRDPPPDDPYYAERLRELEQIRSETSYEYDSPLEEDEFGFSQKTYITFNNAMLREQLGSSGFLENQPVLSEQPAFVPEIASSVLSSDNILSITTTTGIASLD